MGDCQVLETPRPLRNAQKDAQTNTTTPRRHKEMGQRRSGGRGRKVEEASRPGLEARPPSGPEGNGPKVEAGKGEGGGSRNDVGRT